jgi:diaminohydroxyphosphoribosylaminopyrimidine deaminase / 5-amino-6-(5-phosphoribosylamino)uracil reductase
MTEKRPHVIVKLAVSADGKAGLSGRRPVQITGSAVRNRVHLMRAESDAVLTGIGTALSDDPLLTCRLPGMANRSPVRVVLDRQLRLPLDGRLAATAREVPLWVVTGHDAPADREQALQVCGAHVLRVQSTSDLGEVLKALAARGITRLMVEAGPIMSAAFVNADLVDEAAMFHSPNPIGPDGIDALEGLPLAALTKSPRLVMTGSETAGADTVEHFRRKES